MVTAFSLEREDKTAVIRRLIKLGYPHHPAAAASRELVESDADKLELSDAETIEMVAGYQSFLSDDFDSYSYSEHGRPGLADGELGPATFDLIMAPRCEVPDFFPPEHEIHKKGTGNWYGCWDAGDVHCCRDKLDDRNMPGHVRRNWDKIVATVQDAYAEVGLVWLPSKDWTAYNTDMRFVRTSSGYIGLASILNGVGCRQTGFNQYLAPYAANQTDAWIIQHWSVLILHEKFHNAGFGHTNGGIGNPSLRPGTRPTWVGDVAESRVRQKFGGVRVPIPGKPTDPPPPNDPTTPDKGVFDPALPAGVSVKFSPVGPGEYHIPLIRVGNGGGGGGGGIVV